MNNTVDSCNSVQNVNSVASVVNDATASLGFFLAALGRARLPRRLLP